MRILDSSLKLPFLTNKEVKCFYIIHILLILTSINFNLLSSSTWIGLYQSARYSHLNSLSKLASLYQCITLWQISNQCQLVYKYVSLSNNYNNLTEILNCNFFSKTGPPVTRVNVYLRFRIELSVYLIAVICVHVALHFQIEWVSTNTLFNNHWHTLAFLEFISAASQGPMYTSTTLIQVKFRHIQSNYFEEHIVVGRGHEFFGVSRNFLTAYLVLTLIKWKSSLFQILFALN